MRGVSEKIIIGKPISIGTGMFDIAHRFDRKIVYTQRKSIGVKWYKIYCIVKVIYIIEEFLIWMSWP